MKATIFKAIVHLADMDRNLYTDFSLTLARHPSETDERLLVRLVAFLLHTPADSDHGTLEFARDLWNPDEPCLWQRDLTGDMKHWIEVGQPDEKRLVRMSARSERVSVVSYHSSAEIWWAALHPRLARLQNLNVWHIREEETLALATLARRSMDLHVNIQEGILWISDDLHQIELSPNRWFPAKPAQ